MVGYIDSVQDSADRLGVPKAPQNAAAVIHGGRVVASYAKHHLPNYGVFDEARYFVPGDTTQVVQVHGVDVAICICEDLWQDGPSANAKAAEAGLLLVINGSPFEAAKDDVRLELCSRRAREAESALAYVNMVGGQDELVYDGDSIVVDAQGETVARAAQFVEELLVVDLDLPAATPGMPEETEEGRPAGPSYRRQQRPGPRLRPAALHRRRPDPRPRRGLRGDRGGAARLRPQERLLQRAARHVRRHRLHPGRRDRLRRDRRRQRVRRLEPERLLQRALQVRRRGPGRAHRAALRDRPDRPDGRRLPVRPPARRAGRGEPPGQDPRGDLDGPVEPGGHLVLACGNKSELAVGYSTIYGDAVGGFAPIKDVLKTQVWELARWRNAEAERRGRPRRSRRARSPRSRARSSPRPARQRLPAAVPGARRHPRRLHRARLGSAELVQHGCFELVEKVLRMVDGRSTSASSRRARRSPGATSAATGGCRSPAPGARWPGPEPAPAADPGPGPDVTGATARPSGSGLAWVVVRGLRQGASRAEHRRHQMSETTAPYGTGPATGSAPVKRVRTHPCEMKERGERWAMLTAYEQYTAQTFDEAGIPVMLVGDSASNNVYGNETSLPVTVDELIPLVRAVTRSAHRALIVADLPFGSYQASPSRPSTAVRFMKEASARREARGRRGDGAAGRAAHPLRDPVMAHIGPPRSPSTTWAATGSGTRRRRPAAGLRGQGARGGRGVRDRHGDGAREVAPRSPGRCPSPPSASARARDAQVLVWQDMAGLRTGRMPRFVKQYADVHGVLLKAAQDFAADVAAGSFPGDEHTF